MVNLLLPCLQEPRFFVLFVLKPLQIFVREHGNSERILGALVKLTIMSTAKKVSQAYECSLPESDERSSFSSFVIICIQPQT